MEEELVQPPKEETATGVPSTEKVGRVPFTMAKSVPLMVTVTPPTGMDSTQTPAGVAESMMGGAMMSRT